MFLEILLACKPSFEVISLFGSRVLLVSLEQSICQHLVNLRIGWNKHQVVITTIAIYITIDEDTERCTRIACVNQADGCLVVECTLNVLIPLDMLISRQHHCMRHIESRVGKFWSVRICIGVVVLPVWSSHRAWTVIDSLWLAVSITGREVKPEIEAFFSLYRQVVRITLRDIIKQIDISCILHCLEHRTIVERSTIGFPPCLASFFDVQLLNDYVVECLRVDAFQRPTDIQRVDNIDS